MPLKPATRTAKSEISDLALAFGVMREPFAWVVMLVGVVGSLLLFAAIAGLAWWLIVSMGWTRVGWLEGFPLGQWLLGGMGTLVMILIGWFAFPLVVTAVAGLFLESLADRIERRHYPNAPMPRHLSVGEQIRASVQMLLRALGWNLLALPFYFVPVVNVFLYAMLNALLLTREYFQLIALRHVTLEQTRAIYQTHRTRMIRGGLMLALMFVIPGLNLCAPLLATAWMVHRVWRHETSPLRAHFLVAQPLRTSGQETA